MPLVATLLLAGCRSLLGIEEASVVADAPFITDDPPIDSALCFGTEPFEICLGAAPTGARSFTDGEQINTDTACPLVYMHGTQTWCVYAATTIVVPGRLRAIGSRPLVLLAADTFTITGPGIVDVSSVRSITPTAASGAGAQLGPCPFQTNGIAAQNGGGGGAGGTFGTKGGDGGKGDGSLSPGGAAGLPLTGVRDELRGGCGGSRGGSPMTGPCTAGDGGGVVYLLAGTQLLVDGTINASGAAGAGGGSGAAGGCGGGSGGMIVLSSPLIDLSGTGQIFANGGGGGGGASPSSVGSAGMESPGPKMEALGGSAGIGGVGAGRGGDGSLGASAGKTGELGAVGTGGGGGGGGAGVIRVFSAVFPVNDNISPPPSS